METGAGSGSSYTIGGVKVEFPCKAYPTQLSMMSMIIKGIERRQNCLLESPTGSGKSLALLCSCLAWQQNEYRKRDEETAAEECQQDGFKENILCTCDCRKNSPPAENGTAPTPAPPCCSNETCQPSTSNENHCAGDAEPNLKTPDSPEDDDDADFKPSKKRFRTPGSVGGASKRSKGPQGVVFEDPSDDESPDSKTTDRSEAHWKMKLNNESSNKVGEDSEKTSCQCACHSSKGKDLEGKQKEPYKRRKIPKIFFGTRTHKQITQIIRELGKTVYKDVPMCILGSREHTCVHPDVSRSFNKNEGCKELLKGKNGRSCRYYNGAHKIKNQWQLRDRGLTTAWDIEDIVSLGKKIKACPFFAVRSLKDEADIIFCPYNYLVDPMIRMTMDITMKNQIIILDEAHNIEDSAREAASCSVTVDQLEDAVSELDHHIKYEWREVHCRVMHSVSSALLQWVRSHSTNLTQRDFERALRVWSGAEIVAVLRDLGITKDTLATFQHHLAALTEEPEPEQRDQEHGVELSNNVNMTLKGLFLVIEFLFKNDMKYMKDFKVAIIRTIARGNRFQNNENRWISKRRSSSDQSWTLTLNFWCLNPAVAFTDFGEEVRCIILTSGTLSPMSSFQSELGVLFPIQLEANHVVHLSQVWVGTVAMGPNGGSLNGSYKNAETFSFQDEIGLLLLQVCQVIPYGVLCFLPSYGMMNKLSQRWKNTGLWDRLEQVKVVMTEARGAEKINFDEHLREFYEVIKDCESKDIENCSVTGAVCLAVCRGKVSEGMDFADNNARAVMTIGIPFPSIKDTQVELKRQYNDQYSSSRGLLSGSEWYEIQAYRAVNQALGRCIRHKRDWGALILVDDRFGRNPKKYITGLSKWVRGKVVHHTHARDALASLDEFAKARLQCPCPQLPSLPTCASPSSSQALNMTITQELPATPSTPVALPTNDPTQSNILKPITQQGEHSQPLAHATPLKFFRHLSDPNPSPSPQFAFGSGISGPATPINVGSATPIKVGPAMPGAVGTTPATPNFVCPATPISVGPATPMGVGPSTPIIVGPATPISIGPALATPISFRPATPMVNHPTTPLPVGTTSIVYQFGTNTIIIPQQASTRSTLGPTTCSTPKPLKGQLVKQIDNNGTEMVKLVLVKNEAGLPILSPPNKPCIQVVANAQPSVAASCAAKTATVVPEFKENLPQYVAIKLNRMIVEGNSVLKEEGSKSAVIMNGPNQPVVNNAQQNIVTLGVPTPSTFLPTSNADSAIKNKFSACDSREPQSNPCGFAMLPPHNTTAYSSNVVDLTSDAPEATSVQQNVEQMETQRADCNNTPLLFESDDIGFDECPSVVEKATENMGAELSRKQADYPCNLKESDKSVNLPDQAAEEIGTIQVKTPPSSRTVETRLSTKKRRASTFDLADDGGDRERQTRSECRKSLRRSSRSRSGRSKEHSSRARCLDAEGDFLDDIAAKTSQKPQQDAALCRTGLFCATCHCCFTENTNGVRPVSESETGAHFSFLCAQMNKSNLSNSRTKRLSHAPKKFCQCSDLNTPKGRKGTGGGLVLMPAGGLDNLSTLTKTQTATEKDLTLNAHWSEQDQCCYQPITCSVCQTKRNATPTVIGYKLVAMGTTQDSSNVVGQVWLFAKNVNHCERLQLQDQGVPTA